MDLARNQETYFAMVCGLGNISLGLGPDPRDACLDGLEVGKCASWIWPKPQRHIWQWFGGWKIYLSDLAEIQETRFSIASWLEHTPFGCGPIPEDTFGHGVGVVEIYLLDSAQIQETHFSMAWGLENAPLGFGPTQGNTFAMVLGLGNISLGLGQNPRDTFFYGFGPGKDASWVRPKPRNHIWPWSEGWKIYVLDLATIQGTRFSMAWVLENTQHLFGPDAGDTFGHGLGVENLYLGFGPNPRDAFL